MKKIHKILIILIIILLIALISVFIIFKLQNSKNNSPSISEVKKYVSKIYNKEFIIPEFTDINSADPNWIWHNVIQYLNNDENNKVYYTQEELYNIAKKLYGNNFNQKLEKDSSYFVYDDEKDKFMVPAYGIEVYNDYTIDNVSQDNNTFTVSLYDYTVSLFRTLGDNPDNLIDIFNNYDYILNKDNGTPIISIESFNTDEYKNIIKHKNKLSHKILNIVYNKETKTYNITSCKYSDTKPEETLAIYYSKMQDTFEVQNIKYDYEKLYESDSVIVENFDELTSIYTKNGLEIYKTQMSLLDFRDGDVYISAGDIDIRNYISKIEFLNIQESNTEISCDAKVTFRKSFDPDNEDYNNIYEKTNKFKIIKENNEWKVDEFSYNEEQ